MVWGTFKDVVSAPLDLGRGALSSLGGLDTVLFGERPDEQARAELEGLLRTEMDRASPYAQQQSSLAEQLGQQRASLSGILTGQEMGGEQRAARDRAQEQLARLYSQASSARGYGGAQQRAQILRQAPLLEASAARQQQMAARQDAERAAAQQAQLSGQQAQVLSGLGQQEQMRRAQMLELLMRQQQGGYEALRPGLAPYLAQVGAASLGG